jgi:hypothetical protein
VDQNVTVLNPATPTCTGDATLRLHLRQERLDGGLPEGDLRRGTSGSVVAGDVTTSQVGAGLPASRSDDCTVLIDLGARRGDIEQPAGGDILIRVAAPRRSTEVSNR